MSILELLTGSNQKNSAETPPLRADRPEIDESEFIPVCDGYALGDADAVEQYKKVNPEWWENEGSKELKQAIDDVGLSHSEVGELIDLSRKTVGNHARADRAPSVESLEGYIEVFGDDLFADGPRFDIRFRGVTEDE